MERVFSIFLLTSIFLLRFCSSTTSSTANQLGNETDRVALYAFKSQITLDPSQVLNSWNESNHFCEWEGVKCGHKHKRVTKLDLRSRGLVGSISPHIGNLSFLRWLDLRNNSFQGEIPAKVDQLSRLESLILFNNSLEGEIPVNISYCSNLKYLLLFNNHLVGNIPIELGSLQKLVGLNLAFNQLTGGIPPSFGNITSLQDFTLGSNHLDGNIPSTLGQLKNLIYLALGENKFAGIVPPSLYNLSKLEIFEVVLNHHLTGKLPVDIGFTLPVVKNFNIAINQFFGPIPTSLFNASKLEKVDLSGNNITGKVPLAVGNLKNLQWLNLEKNSLGSGKTGDLDFVTSLANCSNLDMLSVSVNNLGGIFPISIGNLSRHLSQLYLGVNKIFGNIPYEIHNLQNLVILSFPVNFLTGSIPTSISNMQNMQGLQLASNRLSGHVPSLKNMSNLFVLELQNNFLEGTISPVIENQILDSVNLSYNSFSGMIPKEIGQCSRLLEVDLTHNLFNGSVPKEVGNLKNLYYFAIAQNKMSGQIPNTLVSCSSMKILYLDKNSLSGPLPPSMDSLVDLRLLDISHNRLSGIIPKELNKLSSLESLNMSFNDFEGEVPMQGIFLNATAFSISENPRVCGGILNLHLSKCQIQGSKKGKTRLSLKVALGVFLPSFVVVMVFVIYLMRKSQSNTSSGKSGLDHKRVSFIDLHRATNGFSSENLIGTGRYGFVYKGRQQGELIAVKVLNLIERGALKTFLAECEALRVIRHRNLLKILTVCSSVDFHGNDFKALVYEFMQNGSLDSWLHRGTEIENEASYLTFHQRLNIAIDIASALDYLHNHYGDPVIHCDLKAGNVLLGDDLTAHVGDFGLAKFLSRTSSSSATDTSSISIRGTIGYIPPEYGAGAKVSTQGDVYSYGILLLEMFTGKRPTDPIFKDGLTLHEYSQLALPEHVMEIIDINVLSELHEETSATIEELKEYLIWIVRIGVACSMDLTTERMSIETAFKELNSIKRNIS